MFRPGMIGALDLANPSYGSASICYGASGRYRRNALLVGGSLSDPLSLEATVSTRPSARSELASGGQCFGVLPTRATTRNERDVRGVRRLPTFCPYGTFGVGSNEISSVNALKGLTVAGTKMAWHMRWRGAVQYANDSVDSTKP